MSIHRLFRTPAPAQSQDVKLSPRQALIEHQAKIAAAGSRLDELGVHEKQARAASDRKDDAQRELDAVADIEQNQIALWAIDPRGPMPPPLVDLLEARAADFADAHAAVVQAQRAVAAVRPLLDKAGAEYRALCAETPKLIRAILLDDAVTLGERLRSAAYERHAAEAALAGLVDYFRLAEDGEAMTAIHAQLRGADGASRERMHLEMRHIASRSRADFCALASRLETDPMAHASIDIEADEKGAA